jgi:hypothetical protein
MKEKFKLIALAIAAIMVITPMLTLSSVKAASWQTINNDPYLQNNSAWSLSVWNQQYGGASWDEPGWGITYTWRDLTGYSNSIWGNTEFVQGYKPIWGTNPYGEPFNMVLLTATMQVSATAELVSTPVANNGANVYIDLWCEFNAGVGSLGYKNMEIIIYLGCYGPSTMCGPGGHFTTTNNDGNGNYWYYAGYRVSTNIGYSYANNVVNINNIISWEASKYGITSTQLGTGAVVGLTFGVEASNSKLDAEWDYVAFQEYM